MLISQDLMSFWILDNSNQKKKLHQEIRMTRAWNLDAGLIKDSRRRCDIPNTKLTIISTVVAAPVEGLRKVDLVN